MRYQYWKSGSLGGKSYVEDTKEDKTLDGIYDYESDAEKEADRLNKLEAEINNN
jgi:hypothetical protein